MTVIDGFLCMVLPVCSGREISPHHLVNVLAGVCSSRKPNTNLVGCCRQALKMTRHMPEKPGDLTSEGLKSERSENTWGWN